MPIIYPDLRLDYKVATHPKTLTLGKPVRMEEDNGADPFRPFPEHFKVRIAQIPAGYIR